VPDDVLTIGVELTVFGEQTSHELPAELPVVQEVLNLDSILPNIEHPIGSLGKMRIPCCITYIE
jgi:hypothetical protein